MVWRIEELSPLAKITFDEIKRVIIGNEDTIIALFTALLAGGHVILEGYTGVGKTTIARTFARVIGAKFVRIQCTPDMTPADILGSYVFNQKLNEYVLRKGPIFANIVLADEIDRASPRTQSAFLEAMQEGQVSIEGTTLKLPRPFMLIATRAIGEVAGTYPLPRIQVDRFMFRIHVPHCNPDEEISILDNIDTIDEFNVRSVVAPSQLLSAISAVRKVRVIPEIKKYIVDLVNYIRFNKQLALPPSPRASICLFKAARARAYLLGRNYVIPDDVKDVAFYALNHRIYLRPEAKFEGITVSSVIADALEHVPVPR